MKFNTCDVCSVSTGFLFGKMEGVYRVMSFLVGRDVFTHELVAYAKTAREKLSAAVVGLPTRDEVSGTNKDNYADRLNSFEARLGLQIDIPDELAGSLSDGRGVMDTLADVLGKKTDA